MKFDPFTMIIASEKLRDYVLNPFHGEGESKARFLEEMGYEQAEWQVLENDLRTQHLPIDVVLAKNLLSASNTRSLRHSLGRMEKNAGFGRFG